MQGLDLEQKKVHTLSNLKFQSYQFNSRISEPVITAQKFLRRWPLAAFLQKWSRKVQNILWTWVSHEDLFEVAAWIRFGRKVSSGNGANFFFGGLSFKNSLTSTFLMMRWFWSSSTLEVRTTFFTSSKNYAVVVPSLTQWYLTPWQFLRQCSPCSVSELEFFNEL